MIISKTPVRISFFGGGTDIPYYYKKNEFGHVVSTSIDKYIYVFVKKQNFLFKEKYRLNYSKTEISTSVSKIKNEIIRECIKYFKIDEKIYIGTVSDVPTSTGLGSSSSFTVGLVNALAYLKNKKLSKYQLAKIASYIEMKLNKDVIGKQDHYAAAYGGLNSFKFLKNDKVIIQSLNTKMKNLKKIQSSIQLFYTGIQRSAASYLNMQQKNYKRNNFNLNLVKEKSQKFEKILSTEEFNIIDFAKDLENSWVNKKKFHNKISSRKIESLYNFAKKNGALAGKILGAGGGGFFLFITPKRKQKNLIKELAKKNIYNLDFKFENNGSKIIFL